MAKELLKPSQYRTALPSADPSLQPNEDQQKELAALYDETVIDFKPGTIITGKVLTANSDGVLVDINYKSDGFIPRYEFNEQELKSFKPDSEIEVIIDELENMDGNVVLSYEKAKACKAWGKILALYEEGKPVEGYVSHKVKGGLSVDIGIPAFLPGSQVDIQRVTDFDQYVGQTITAHILKVNQKRGNVIISRRKHLNEQRQESRQKVLKTIEEGQVIQGVVKNITNYGAFIDIGGVDGLLHITDMTWGRISHPSEILNIGDNVTVKVLSLDKENEKISLGMKQLSPNPWEALSEEIEIGKKIKGKVSSITDYGLFVEVEKGVEGLVHISEVSWTDRIGDLRKHFKVNDEIDVVVVSLDKENRRMSLSIKQLEKNPWDKIAEQFSIGQKVKGKISNITDFGIFVQLLPGIDGLVHISDLSWTEHIKHPSDVYKKDQEVEAVVTDINAEKKKISLSVKQLADNPWDKIAQDYPVGSHVEGEISKTADFGAFVKLPNGIEGLVHMSELEETKDQEIKVGEKRTFRVVKINPEEHKISLSLNLEEKPAKTAAKPRKQARTSEKPRTRTQEAPSKMKTQLQIELEKMAAAKEEK